MLGIARGALRVVVLLLAGATSLAAQRECKKPGSDRWAIKTDVRNNTMRPRWTFTVPELVVLDAPASVDADGAKARFQARRIPDFVSDDSLREGSFIRLEGYLRLVAHDDGDCDYHIQIAATPDGTDVVIVEVPASDYVTRDALRARIEPMREWVRARLLEGKDVSLRGNLMNRPPYVYVEGQLFFDQHHHPHCDSRGKKGMPAATCWEVHPITAIGFAPRP